MGTAFSALGTAAPALDDLLAVVDVSDTTQAASGSTKKITVLELLRSIRETFSASRSSLAADRGKVLEYDGAGAGTYTVEASQFSDGDWVVLVQVGAGQLTVAAGAGVTINAPSTKGLKTTEQWSHATLRCRGSDTFVFFGDTTA